MAIDKEEVRKHVREYMEETKTWRQDSEDMGGVFRNNVNNFVLSVSIIYAIQQDAYQRTSSTDVFEMAIEYLAFAVGAIIVNIFLKNHILDAPKPPIGAVAFRAFYYILQSIQSYYIFLLVNLAKEQVAKSANEDSWDHYNLIPISFTVTIYYVFDEIRRTFLSSSQSRVRRKIISKKQIIDQEELIHVTDTYSHASRHLNY